MPSANKTPNINLSQWAGNEYVKRQDFCDDNLKIDKAIGDLKKSIENIDLADTNISVTDPNNKFEGTTLDKVLDELDDKSNTNSTDNSNLEKRVKKLENERPNQVLKTIERAKWSGNKYSLDAEYPFSTYDIYIVDFGKTVTENQMWAWQDAMIIGSTTENVLTAIATTGAPKVDIPIVLEIVKKGV